MFFQTLAPAPDTNVTPSNPSVARRDPSSPHQYCTALVKNEEGAAPLLQQAAPLAEHPDHAVYLDDELDHMRWKMRRVGRKMARQAARAEAHAVDSLARSADANRRICAARWGVRGGEKGDGGIAEGVLGLKTRAAEGKMEIEGLRGRLRDLIMRCSSWSGMR
ncbi:hypothetical protein DID88_008179 [Monilinia fructigena]|uniref:Uncharacterized protein n=1 Tax=Monilinia fructigena TaxID=38457 RepID=A0A395J5M3_9HELO|nr:hypothetical protein DID88_008179 [Monilinia fructigena]